MLTLGSGNTFMAVSLGELSVGLMWLPLPEHGYTAAIVMCTVLVCRVLAVSLEWFRCIGK